MDSQHTGLRAVVYTIEERECAMSNFCSQKSTLLWWHTVEDVNRIFVHSLSAYVLALLCIGVVVCVSLPFYEETRTWPTA